MDGALFILVIRATLILSQGGVAGQMERNGGAQGTLLQTKSTVKGI